MWAQKGTIRLQIISTIFFRQLLFLMVLFLLSACVHLPPPGYSDFWMLPGTLTSLSDGTEVVFELAYTHKLSGGVMRAANSKTGERFAGNFQTMDTGDNSTGVVTNAWGAKTAEIRTTSGQKTVKGIVKGNQGTIINLTLGVQVVKDGMWGANCSGFGDAVDNKGVRYQAQLANQAKKYQQRSLEELLWGAAPRPQEVKSSEQKFIDVSTVPTGAMVEANILDSGNNVSSRGTSPAKTGFPRIKQNQVCVIKVSHPGYLTEESTFPFESLPEKLHITLRKSDGSSQ